MKLELKRIAKKPTYTIGKLYIDSKYFCDIIEDCDRGLADTMSIDEIKKKKVYGETAIPSGTYKVDISTVSPKFGSKSWAKEFKGIVPRLINVKGYEGVLIHPGNTAKDTLGCLLCGENKKVGQVINSQATWKKLMNILLKDKNNITITVK